MVLHKKISWIALFFFTVVVADRLIGIGLRKMYFMQHFGNRFNITYALDSTKANLLILGNSRAAHHYVSSVFEDSLNLSCFNTGRDGEGISFNYALLSGIVKRYIPRTVILDFNTESYYKKRVVADDLTSLLPYYGTHSGIRAILIQQKKFETLKQLSAIYPFNSTILSSAMGISATSLNPLLKGYIPLTGRLNDSISLKISDLNNREIDLLKWRDFTNLIDCCKQNNIKLIVVQSPRFSIQKNDRIKNMADSLLTSENVSFFDYKSDPFFLNHSEYFKDAAHLNKEGANLFSSKLVKAIAGELKNVAASSL